MAKIIYDANDKKKTALFSLENFDGDVEMSMLRKEYNLRTDSCYSARQWQTGKDLDINENELVITRVPQRHIQGWKRPVKKKGV